MMWSNKNTTFLRVKIKWNVLICLAAFSAYSSLLNARVDLRKGLPRGHPDFMSLLSQDNQGDLGICYSYASTAMIHHYLLYLNGGQDFDFRISPLALAIQMKAYLEAQDPQHSDIHYPPQFATNYRKVNFGWIRYVLDALNEKGYSYPRDFDQGLARLDPIPEDAAKHYIDRLFYYFSHRKNKRQNVLKNTLAFIEERSFKKELPLSERHLKHAFSNNSYINYLNELLEMTMPEDRIKLPFIRYDYFSRFNQGSDLREDLLTRVHERLNLGGKTQPIGVRYCSNFLYEREETPGLEGYFSESDADKNPCNMHVSLIIGMRSIKRRNQLLVRDSYGKSCEGYQFECENGNLWIDEETFSHQINSITYIVP